MGVEAVQTMPLDAETKLIFCGQCGAIHGVVGLMPKPLVVTGSAPKTLPPKVVIQPPAPPKPAPPPPKTPQQLKLQAIMEQIGQADLTKKRQEYEKKLQQRAMAVQKGSSHYLHVAFDDGPPHCLKCQVDMKPLIVPPDYPNAKRKVWLCPNLCGEWEADTAIVTEPRAIQPDNVTEKSWPVFEPRVVKPSPVMLLSDRLPHATFAMPDLAFMLKEILQQPVSLTDSQAAEMLMYAQDKASHNFVCQLHIYQLVKLVVPKGLPQAQRTFWACPMYRNCHHWFWLGETQPILEHVKITSPCPKCGFQLHQMTIPQGYAQSGKLMWVCQNCQYYKQG
jgi:hypothetical protein